MQILTNNNSGEVDKDIKSLREFLLIEHDEFEVYCAPFDCLGSVMDEIAIAREVTFREVGEGTGFVKRGMINLTRIIDTFFCGIKQMLRSLVLLSRFR